MSWEHEIIFRPKEYTKEELDKALKSAESFHVVKPDTSFLNRIACDTVLVDKLNEAMMDHLSHALQKRDAMITNRLRELGFDVSDLKATAKRCSIVIMPGSDVFVLWIDRGLKTETFVCRYTDPKFTGKGSIFVFEVTQ